MHRVHKVMPGDAKIAQKNARPGAGRLEIAAKEFGPTSDIGNGSLAGVLAVNERPVGVWAAKWMWMNLLPDLAARRKCAGVCLHGVHDADWRGPAGCFFAGY
jgi:hypothetical protein